MRVRAQECKGGVAGLCTSACPDPGPGPVFLSVFQSPERLSI